MLTFITVVTVFTLGAMALAVGAGVLSFGFNLLGHIAKGIFSLAGIVLMPIALILAACYSLGFMLPILVPIALVLVIVAVLSPKKA